VRESTIQLSQMVRHCANYTLQHLNPDEVFVFRTMHLQRREGYSQEPFDVWTTWLRGRVVGGFGILCSS